jgi:glycosyltransferase involved in cell wall biosynthesis
MKIFVGGFRGHWGWVKDFEEFINNHIDDIKISDPEDADVIFCSDHASWKPLEKYIGKKKIIANVLDLAEWVGENKQIDEYIDFCRKVDKVTAISQKVIDQLDSLGLKNVDMFYYPSQIRNEDLGTPIPKRNQIISFCRLGDPGKAIGVSVKAFVNSGLVNKRWRYFLVGQESPNFNLSNIDGVQYLGYQSRESLFNLVKSCRATVMPSYGEGLGLPAIESTLLGTPSIIRNISPCREIMGDSAIIFNDDNDLVNIFSNIDDLLVPNMCERVNLNAWIREHAFNDLIDMLRKNYEG